MLPLIALILSIILAAALLELRRARELHHGYIGAFLCFVGLATPDAHGFVVFLGLILLADDDVQHVWQAISKLLGHPIPNDFTPIHHLGSVVLEFLENTWHTITGIAFFRKSSSGTGGGGSSAPRPK